MVNMSREFQPVRHIQNHQDQTVKVEIYVAAKFNEHEVSSITNTLACANEILRRDVFKPRYVSSKPGLVTARGGQMVRAEPAIDEHGLSDMMFVVGGGCLSATEFLPRVRQMTRRARCIVLLSSAATRYIQATTHTSGALTTHWKDAETLREAGYYPTLTNTLAEQSGGVITAAGSGSTTELIIGLIAPYLEQTQIAELGNTLLLPTLRKSDAEQPQSISGNAGLFDRRVTEVIQLMEAHIVDPLDMRTLTRRVGLSSRQVERVFKEVLQTTPARFYKTLRTKRAWALIEDTLMPLADVAVATGFGSVSTMSLAVQREFGMTPSQSRARKSVSLIKFETT